MQLPNLDFDYAVFAHNALHITIAYLLAVVIGWDREKDARSAGLRTFPIVAMASCGFVLIAVDVLTLDPQAQSRVLYGLMTGMGFIGGGAILKNQHEIVGTATAASIWNTGAIGAAVGYERYEIAVLLTLFNFLTLRFITPLKHLIKGSNRSKD